MFLDVVLSHLVFSSQRLNHTVLIFMVKESINSHTATVVKKATMYTAQASVIRVVEGMHSWPASSGGNDMYSAGL